MATAAPIAESTAVAVRTRPARILSVDVLRGITIAFMILVNDPGDGHHTFVQLEHADWNGWTLTDLVFPTFLFLVGVASIFSLEARERAGNCRKTLAGQIFWRATKIFLLKTLLSLAPFFHWQTMRIYGVLTRIALCYLLAGLILLMTRRVATLLGIVVLLLAGYWALMRWVPVPGIGLPVRDVPFLDKNLNLAAWMDRGISAWTLKWLHTGTLYEHTRDPEGLLSTIPALATTLLGAVTGIWMRRPRDGWWGSSVAGMRTVLALAGLCSFAAGELWNRWFPINKNLWTSSYVLMAAGLAAMGLAACSLLVDRREEPWPLWLRVSTWPWKVFGANAIAAYAMSVILAKTLGLIRLSGADGRQHSLSGILYQNVFAHGHSNEWTSLAFSCAFVVACFLPIWWLWSRKIFLKL